MDDSIEGNPVALAQMQRFEEWPSLIAVAGGASPHLNQPGSALPAPSDISFVRSISPGSASILAAKAAEIAPCRDFNEEALIFGPL